MPRHSPVAGVSGSCRVQRLSAVAFAAAEAHGKRLDWNGRARAITDDAPVTTTGLDLGDLYGAHVDGVFIPRSKTKALHLILQYPTELMDGDDAPRMLTHARRFVASVFGPEAVFADRVDRDEKSRHVVDLFIAPRYEKRTKHTCKTAISFTRHLKALAQKWGKAPHLRGQGQALQDAWHAYLREEVGLEAQRGSPKARPGDDWLSPEALEVERLHDVLTDLSTARNLREMEVDQLDEQAAALRAASAEAEKAAAAAEKRRKEEDKQAAELQANLNAWEKALAEQAAAQATERRRLVDQAREIKAREETLEVSARMLRYATEQALRGVHDAQIDGTKIGLEQLQRLQEATSPAPTFGEYARYTALHEPETGAPRPASRRAREHLTAAFDAIAKWARGARTVVHRAAQQLRDEAEREAADIIAEARRRSALTDGERLTAYGALWQRITAQYFPGQSEIVREFVATEVAAAWAKNPANPEAPPPRRDDDSPSFG